MARKARPLLASLIAIGCALGFAMAAHAAGPPVLPHGPLHPAGRWLKDATGRVIIVHGLELARKTPPYYAPVQSFSAQDAQNIEDWGFDAVRLAWFWKGLEPERGQIDAQYLGQLVRAGRLLAQHHVFTLLEAHQDGFNETLGGAGFPDWATITDSTWSPVESVPGTGVFDLQAARAFDNLYANTEGIADEFARAWSVVAAGFRHDPMLLGYDLFNEPNPGSQWATCANPAGCPAFDEATLEPLENRLAAAIRAAGGPAIAYYEPNIYFDSGVPSWLRSPPRRNGPSGFAFHDYCLVAQLTGQPDHESSAPGYPACRPLDNQVFGNAVRAATAMGVPPLFDEFGDTQDLPQIERVLKLADRSFTGWVYWSYKDWVDDPGGQGSGPLFDDSDDNGTLRTAKLAELSEPYPIATAGIPLAERWDQTTAAFSYTYLPDRRISAPTVIFAAPLHYPDGYRVAVGGARVVSAPGARFLELSPDRRIGAVHVRLTPVAASPAQTPPDATLLSAAVAPIGGASSATGSFGTASGSCNDNADRPASVSSAPIAAGAPDVLARIQLSGGAGEVTAQDAISAAYRGGDTSWLDLGAVPAGGAARATIICRSGATSYELAFDPPPVLPATFSGSSSHDTNVSLASSRLAFTVPATGHYLADVSLTRGAVELGLRRADDNTPPAGTFTGDGVEDLGTLTAGTRQSLDVIAVPGAQARWTITIRPA